MLQRTPSNILVAVDFGEASAAALALAGRFAAAVGARLIVLHAEAVEVPPYFTHEQLDAMGREVRAAQESAETALREFVQRHTSAPAQVRVVGPPEAEAILAASREAELVVVGTHGRRGPKRWWLGSVAERVVRESHVPVLVVHARPEPPHPAPSLSPMILGGEAAGSEVRHWAELLASAFGGPVLDGPDADACDPARVAPTSLVVVGLPEKPADRVLHERVVSLARTCTVPVLFVPGRAVAPRPAVEDTRA
jgi:nucleotide-binding universal stress UspA family protein